MAEKPALQHVASLDIGGTKMAACIADASGPLLRVTQSTMKSGSPDTIAQQGIQLIDVCCQKLQIDPAQIQAVGVSSCGPFEVRDGATGIVPPNRCGGLPSGDDLPNDWTFLPLESVLRERFAEVRVANDCVAALHGERAAAGERRRPRHGKVLQVGEHVLGGADLELHRGFDEQVADHAVLHHDGKALEIGRAHV